MELVEVTTFDNNHRFVVGKPVRHTVAEQLKTFFSEFDK